VSLLNDGSTGTLLPQYADIVQADAMMLLKRFNSSKLLSSIGFHSHDEQQKCMEQVKLMGADLADAHKMNYNNLQSFTRSSDAAIYRGPGDRIAAFTRYLLKLLGRRYVGVAASWLRDELQDVARRVVSEPQQPYGSHIVQTAPTFTKTSSPRRPKLVKRSATKSSNASGSKIGLTSKAVAKARRVKQDKNVLAASQEDPWVCTVPGCKQYGKQFYDRSNYLRHMNKTKGHGARTFNCPDEECDHSCFRIDHFQEHLRKWHGLRARGRSGKYEFVPVETLEESYYQGHSVAAELAGSNVPVEMPAAFDEDMSFQMFT
jgi:hypothetical protein